MERYTEKINKHILVIKQNDSNNQLIVSVFYDYIPVARFNHDKSDERKLAAVELVERQICNITTAAQISGFHRNTISKFLVTKKTLGIKALLEENRGLKKPLKYSADVRDIIERLLSQHPGWSDQDIAKQASESLDMDVHRNGVARIRVANSCSDNDEVVFSKDRLIELSNIAETIDQQKNDDRQLELNFEADEQFKQKKEQLEQLEPLQSTNKTEQHLIDRLQQGQRSPFAGSFMHHLFLNEINYEKLFDCLAVISGNTYQNTDILSTIYFSIAIGLNSIESLKLINSKDFGCMLGIDRSPDKDVIRKKLHTLSEGYYSGELIDRFARILLENRRIDDEVFFIDGHFLPYYGLHVIAKGYYTVRRLAMKGNELYVISDLNGRPLFSITESNEVDFRPIILRAADKLSELGIKRPILTFDRGGYGVRFFSELDDKADFVTWAKYLSDKQLDRISDESFKHGLPLNDKRYLVAEQFREVSESIQTAKKEGRDRPITIPLRLVVIENIDTGKRMGIYTNNKDKPASDIAYYMLNRWGDSENLYKKLMAKFNLDYHPGYDIEELENQPFVDNPDIALIKEAIKILEKEIDQLSTSQQDIQNRLSNRKDKRLTKKLSQFVKELEDKKNETSNFEEKLKALPEKVSIVELLKGKKMSRCELEKKKLYDLMQFMVLHSYERLEDFFKPYYQDTRDIKPILRMITGKAGYLKLIGDTLIVLLDRIDLKKYQFAAEQLCHQLNKMNIILNGRIKMKLYFYLSKY
jgi:transposase